LFYLLAQSPSFIASTPFAIMLKDDHTLLAHELIIKLQLFNFSPIFWGIPPQKPTNSSTSLKAFILLDCRKLKKLILCLTEVYFTH